jgi:hypothetical protein
VILHDIAYTGLSRRWVLYGWRQSCLVWVETEMSGMAVDDCLLWYGLMAFSCTCTCIYISLVALLDRIQSSFPSITISTGYEPGAHYHLYYECSIYISQSWAWKTLNHPWPSLFVTVATAAHKHTKNSTPSSPSPPPSHSYHVHIHNGYWNLQERLPSLRKTYIIFIHTIPSHEHLPVRYHLNIADSIHESIPYTSTHIGKSANRL